MQGERPVIATSKGLARYLKREASQIDELQFFREAVQNEIEAGATKVIIDGYRSPDDYDLARVSGNGHGMTDIQLRDHLITLFESNKSENNYGVGARIASLYHNPAGVSWASRTAEGEGVITLHESDEGYSAKLWDMGEGERNEIVAPIDDELEHIPETGTAVILHGKGNCSTWDNKQSHRVHSFLTRRYLRLPNDFSLIIKHSDDTVNQTLIPFGNVADRHALAKGSIPFKDINELSGFFHWWFLPTAKEMSDKVSGHNSISSGIGLLVQNEIFQYARSYLTDFGVLYTSIQSRVIILTEINNAKMGTNRASVYYEIQGMTDKNVTPWKALGRYFADNMPPELQEELDKIKPSGSDYTDIQAKLLDPDWQRSLSPVSVYTPTKIGEPAIGTNSGSGLPPGELIPENPPGEDGERKKPKRAAYRKTGGNDPGKLKQAIVTPSVKFIPDDEMPQEHLYRIFYAETSNEIIISEAFEPYQREIREWEKDTKLDKATIELAVKKTFSLEYPAYIIDCNGQKKVHTPVLIDKLKSEEALYGKALGRQAIKDAIGAMIRSITKEQRQAESQEETNTPPVSEGRRGWSEEDINTLKRLARNKINAKEIAKVLGRTEAATRHKAFTLGISLETRG